MKEIIIPKSLKKGDKIAIISPAGFVEEVRQLKTRNDLHPDLPSIRCVGYRQVWSYLDGKINHLQMREQSIFATRQLAKRQMTWLRSRPNRVLVQDIKEIVQKIQ